MKTKLVLKGIRSVSNDYWLLPPLERELFNDFHNLVLEPVLKLETIEIKSDWCSPMKEKQIDENLVSDNESYNEKFDDEVDHKDYINIENI